MTFDPVVEVGSFGCFWNVRMAHHARSYAPRWVGCTVDGAFLPDTARMIDRIHHLASLEDWARRTPELYAPAGLADEGFIHLCTREQLPGVVERYYQGRDDLILLTVSVDRLQDLVWEDSTGSGERFPHLYGPLSLSAVASFAPFEQRA